MSKNKKFKDNLVLGFVWCFGVALAVWNFISSGDWPPLKDMKHQHGKSSRNSKIALFLTWSLIEAMIVLVIFLSRKIDSIIILAAVINGILLTFSFIFRNKAHFSASFEKRY